VNVLVVHAHPDPASFNHTLFETAVTALRAGGHTVETIDLYAEGFSAVMTAAERKAYHSPAPILDPQVARHAQLVRWANALVFVYPTWWAGLPAILKGWLDRVLVAGVAFDFHPRTHKVRPALRNARLILGISTYGSPRWFGFAMADAGRRTLLRALWLCCPRRTRRRWIAMHGIDGTSEAERTAFLHKVDRELRAL
jgi:putative NADPH-quinone reductase